MNILDQLYTLEISKEKVFDVDMAIDKTFMDVEEEVGVPPFFLHFLQGAEPTGIFTLGDISVLAGQPKSRKSLLRLIFTASAINNEEDTCGIIRCNLPEEKQGVLVIDSEQSKYHAHKAVKRAMKLAGKVNDPLFKSYRLREYSPDERKLILEKLLGTTPELGFVIIDGISDFVSSVNDEGEAKQIVDWLDKMSSKYHCHIMVVIHENKGSSFMRGHLGSELQRKAQAIISVTRKDDEVSLVEPRDMRDFSFKPFAIGYDENNNPTIFHDYEAPTKASSKGKTKWQPEIKKRLSEYSSSEHCDNLSKIFNGLGVTRLRNEEVKSYVREGYGDNFFRQDANACCQFFLDNGLLEKVQEPGKGKAGIYYQLTDKVKAEKSPF